MKDGNIVVGTLLVRRIWVERVGGFDPALRQSHDDWDFFVRLARAGCSFACARQAVMIYRDHSGGAHREFASMLPAGLHILDQMYADAETDAALKAQIEPVRGKAYCAMHLWAAEFFFESSQFASGAQSLNDALQNAPVGTRQMHKVASGLARWVLAHPEAQDESVVQQALAPVKLREVREPMIRHALGLINFELAFRAYASGQRRRAFKHSFKAMVHDPRHLLNRGWAKLAVSSLIPGSR